ncbi:agmatine deiminase family protein [Hymenobacter sp. IS2118]|uniref:agmatine deiminase family protein n=1 Tax=Hymenobacter sp. IS2118 TaxID=1505605 RepID=UPI0005577C72|nr:agmatine deiminase family protein [Hymenobacter sp. IS2118]
MSDQILSEEHAQLWQQSRQDHTPEATARLRELLGQLEAAYVREAAFNEVRLREQGTDEAWYAGVGHKNNVRNHLVWRLTQGRIRELHTEFLQAAKEAFGTLEEVETTSVQFQTGAGLLTDFAPVRQVYLVFPDQVVGEGWDYSPLAGFYIQLLKAIPADLEVVLLVKSSCIANRLKANSVRERIRYVVHNELESIWLRDYAGFNMGTHLVKPVFSPKRIGDNMKLLHSLLGVDLVALPLVWDGGNLVSNGRYGFVSTRMLQHNTKKSKPTEQVTIELEEPRESIGRVIQAALQIQPVWVELPGADKLAHTDGYVAFISPNKALVSTFPEAWAHKYPKDQQCVDALAQQLRELDIKVVRIQEQPQDVAGPSPIDSAVGLYVNMLQLNGHWLVPTYGLEGEREILTQLERLNPGGSIIPIECTELAKLGGVLHCISFCN